MLRWTDYRAQASMKAEKKALAGNIVRWVEKIGEGIDNLPRRKTSGKCCGWS